MALPSRRSLVDPKYNHIELHSAQRVVRPGQGGRIPLSTRILTEYVRYRAFAYPV
jgi:hypothetical protein